MGRMSADAIDECCEEMKGHKNWAYFDTLSNADRKKALKGEMIVVFWDKADKEAEHREEE